MRIATVYLLISIATITSYLTGAEPRDALWIRQLDGSVFSSAAVGAGDVLFIGTQIEGESSGLDSGRVYGISRSGEILFTYTTHDWVEANPAINEDNSVVVGDWSGRIYALNADGSEKWVFEESVGDLFLGSPAISEDGMIILGGADGLLYAVSPSGDPEWVYVSDGAINSSAAVGPSGDIVFIAETVGGAQVTALASDGGHLWTVPVPGRNGGLSVASSGPAIDASGTVFVTYEIEFEDEQSPSEGGLIAVSSSGAIQWNFEVDSPVHQTPIISDDGTVYIITQDGLMLAIDSNAEGAILWALPVGPVYYSSPTIAHNRTIYVIGYDAVLDGSRIFAVGANGQIIWEGEILDIVDASPVINMHGELAVGNYIGQISMFQADGPASPRGWSSQRRDPRGTGRFETEVPPNPFDTFPGSAEFGMGWSFSPTFGYYYRINFPWIYHVWHGWWYCIGGDESLWIYDINQEITWLWTSELHFPFFWNVARSTWLYYVGGSADPRQFYDMATGELLSF